MTPELEVADERTKAAMKLASEFLAGFFGQAPVLLFVATKAPTPPGEPAQQYCQLITDRNGISRDQAAQLLAQGAQNMVASAEADRAIAAPRGAGSPGDHP